MSMRNVRYTIDLSPAAWLALEKHGYDPSLPARGIGGPPGRIKGTYMGKVNGEDFHFPLRNRVCELEGVLVDGHEASDLDPGGECIHCGKNQNEWLDWCDDD